MCQRDLEHYFGEENLNLGIAVLDTEQPDFPRYHTTLPPLLKSSLPVITFSSSPSPAPSTVTSVIIGAPA